ncbi:MULTISPECIES: TetR/AcrR family transcriptional regulator [unclassified Enterococcus]|uniref:TetR/AcrR family transcriptional regulator n=1 Tax=unclassified Enterococcus TaxID=2608891 RepID=UPI001CE0B69D|nr:MULTISPECIES: TetR/AcrR family transcriptional regulator [unclassified Enterococcus]MCA5012681.1 TetR/AcrR family transcriptional regulator [Enterococcus sp. S23]MCA5015932.1 TetR/AcrR family transcriptional regulator [Enterococcus sp. S22(2020)]
MEKEIVNTRDRIIQVATRLFMDNGYLGTSTRQIAQLAEVTQPNLYHHFKNKEEVYIGVIETLLSDVNEELVVIVEDQKLDTVSKLKRFAECLKTKHPFDFDLMMHDFNTKLMEETQYKLFMLWNQSYKEPLLRLFKTSDFPIRSGVSPEIATTHFLNTLSPYIKAEQRTTTLTIDQVVDLFLNGITSNE